MKTVVAGIVIFNNEILIGKKITKRNHFLSGGWHIPGGHVFENEDLIASLIREFKEETNLEISVIHKIVEKPIPENNVVVHWYLCKSESANVVPGDDLSDLKFVNRKNVVKECDIRATRFWPKEVMEYLME